MGKLSKKTKAHTRGKNKKHLTNIQKIHFVEDLINKRIRPALKQDGGDIDLIDLDHDVVYVKLKGACATCPSSTNTMRQFIEKEIQKELSPYMKVEEARK